MISILKSGQSSLVKCIFFTAQFVEIRLRSGTIGLPGNNNIFSPTIQIYTVDFAI